MLRVLSRSTLQDARFREALQQQAFDALRAAAYRNEIGAAAFRAGMRHACLVTAMVAAQALFVKVQHHVAGTMRAA